jgi:hypothetical protein
VTPLQVILMLNLWQTRRGPQVWDLYWFEN